MDFHDFFLTSLVSRLKVAKKDNQSPAQGRIAHKENANAHCKQSLCTWSETQSTKQKAALHIKYQTLDKAVLQMEKQSYTCNQGTRHENMEKQSIDSMHSKPCTTDMRY